jgi:hypothetical protein
LGLVVVVAFVAEEVGPSMDYGGVALATAI